MARSNYAGGSTSLADFKQMALLGEGAYSAVYKVMRLADREIYALKKVKMPSLSDKEKQNALNEVRLLASVRHDNVIAYKEAFFDDKTRCLCIVQEIADVGDLLQQINRCKQDRSYLREADVWRYLEGMALGLKALHDMRVLHRDMKSANVFISQSRDGGGQIAKLGDFNVSKVAKRGLCMTQTGTPYYASPEVWRDMPYDGKSDMWSLGCVLYEMVALRPPFRAEDMEGLYRKVIRGQYPRIPSHYSQDLAEVIQALLQVHPRHRPTVDQLLQMPAMERNRNGPRRPESGYASDLLGTIKLPKNPVDLSVALPKPRYSTPADISEEESNAGSPPAPNAQSRMARDASARPNELPGLPEKRQVTASTPGLPAVPHQQPVLDPRRLHEPPRGLASRRGVPAEVQRRQLQSPSPAPTPGCRTPMRPPPPNAQQVPQEVGDSLDAYLQGRQNKEGQAEGAGLGGQVLGDPVGVQAADGSPPPPPTGRPNRGRQRPLEEVLADPAGAKANTAANAQPLGSPVVYSRDNRQYGVRPTINPVHSQQRRLSRDVQQRRPLSIYTLQQYAAVDQAQQQVDAQKEASAARRHRPLVPQLL